MTPWVTSARGPARSASSRTSHEAAWLSLATLHSCLPKMQAYMCSKMLQDAG